ncbi:hypothetical protein TNCV_3963241 [Trichonephila clavipes]|nr:hypothetical protein TNCV_3963241 [Trichonephila clavipes]
MKKGGFPIRKWASNESSVLESLPTELRSSGSTHRRDHLMKILGIIWNSKKDTFRINISPPNEVRPTNGNSYPPSPRFMILWGSCHQRQFS